jgi:GNAT superfamily N-acetyltransferase
MIEMDHPAAAILRPLVIAGEAPVREAVTDEEILATREVMLQLRPHIAPDDYLPRVRRMMRTDGYHLVAGVEDGVVRAVAGFRLMEMLYCGRILYVDDLITDEAARSAGWGARLLEWLRWRAAGEGCDELHLDSGTHRNRAHSFYFREGMTITAFHFAEQL